eukprot:CAMPEP_0115722646 /NCGR_PEP_ID=MMETSP0272-20121206/79794_1 /TAXON_ID=71861 /ORGANISM="Scrippsiella trochoidea, Strain CCMP3099" /LENGTH=99 /DNA_ID=CAMNT_0003165693 /DNA_START=582 /DNA_END=877 /DNA_ORIENTATION=+
MRSGSSNKSRNLSMQPFSISGARSEEEAMPVRCVEMLSAHNFDRERLTLRHISGTNVKWCASATPGGTSSKRHNSTDCACSAAAATAATDPAASVVALA